MYWYSDDTFSRQKSGLNKVFYGHRSSSVFFLTNILKYRLDRQLSLTRFNLSASCGGKSLN